MHRIISMCLDAAIAAVVLIPLFLYLDKRLFHHRKRTLGFLLFAVYLCGMFAVVGLPDICYVRFRPNLNLIPFAYMFSDFTNSFLNVVLFVPLGFFLPVFWERFRTFHKALFFGFSCSAIIEFLQIFTYRATDVNDLITNVLGTFLGWCIARLVLRFVSAFSPGEQTNEVYVVCGSAFGVMFFIQPFLADVVWSFLYR